jgi:cell division protein FtsN
VAEPKPPVDAAAPATSSIPAEHDADKKPEHSNLPIAKTAPRKIPAPVPVSAKVDDNDSELAKAVEQPAPSTAARSSGGEAAWAVQLAASREKTVTEAQVAKLKAKGYDSYSVEAERDGQTWYRLRVGRFATRGEADALREILVSREGYRSPFVTTD